MKICWDMLEGIYLTKNGTFRKGRVSYVYKESCVGCGNPYLTPKHKQSKFCGVSCASKGKKFSDEHKKKISMAKVGTKCTEGRKKLMSKLMFGKKNPMYGKTHTSKAKKKISESNSKYKGASAYNWKGGVKALGVTTYDTQKDKLSPYEDIRKQEGTEILEVRCAYCNQWFVPTKSAVDRRLAAINNLNQGECRLYCSTNCKLACPTYGQVKYPKGFKYTSSREVNPYLRKMVLERDNWTCQICGKTSKEAQLHVHHMDPVAQNPMFQNDMDSCITLCKGCHTMVHKRRGCRYIDLRCNRETDYTKEFKEGIRLKSINSQE